MPLPSLPTLPSQDVSLPFKFLCHLLTLPCSRARKLAQREGRVCTCKCVLQRGHPMPHTAETTPDEAQHTCGPPLNPPRQPLWQKWTPLHYSAHDGRTEVVTALLAARANVNERSVSGSVVVVFGWLEQYEGVLKRWEHQPGRPGLFIFS
jgi:hypothetical protein